MPKFLNSAEKQINPILFDAPIDNGLAILSNLIKDFRERLSSGIFLVPGWQIKQEKLKDKTPRGYIFTLTYQPNKADQQQIEEAPILQGGLNIYKLSIKRYNIKPELTAYIIFTVDSNKDSNNFSINGLATNLDPESFRKLMCLSFSSTYFYEKLEFTEYWLPDMDSVWSKKNLTDCFNALGNPTLLKAEHMAGAIEWMHNYSVQSKKLDDAKAQPNWRQNFDRAYAQAKVQGFPGTEDDFWDPICEKSTQFVAKQFVPLLVKNKIVPDVPPVNDKRLVLFVGEGDGQNMQAFKNHYPQYECFGIEPLTEYAIKAKEKLGKNRIFEMTADEFAILLPSALMKQFHLVLVSNFNVNSQISCFMKALDHCVMEAGQVVIGVSFVDQEYIGSNFSIRKNMDKVFRNDTVESLSLDYNFTQRLYTAKGSSVTAYNEANEKNTQALEKHPLTKKINDLNMKAREENFQALRTNNKSAFDELARVFQKLKSSNDSSASSNLLISMGKKTPENDSNNFSNTITKKPHCS
ncbi:MAG: hypothetical protein WC748_06000 [Legionellales bacterium]|jgi:hypothetical protein